MTGGRPGSSVGGMHTPRDHLTALRWGAAALVAAILADLAEDLVDPTGSGTAAEVFEAASQHHGRTIASAVFLLATSVLIVPAVFGLARTLEGRGRNIGRAAAGLALLGSMGHAALAALYLSWAAMPSSGAGREQLVGVIERIHDSGWVALLLPLIVAFPLSLVTVFVGLVRGRIVPRWVLLPVLAAPVAAAVVPGSDTLSTGTALVLLLIAACGLAARVFREPPAEPAAPRSAPATA